MTARTARRLANQMTERPDIYVIGVSTSKALGPAYVVSARDLTTGFQFQIASPIEWERWQADHTIARSGETEAETRRPIEAKRTHRKHEIRFGFGNNTEGPIGACVSVYADTAEEGLAQLKAVLTEARFEDGIRLCTPEGLEDLVVYFNPGAIRVTDIEDEEIVD